LVAKKVDQSISANNQGFKVKKTQQKSPATFLPIFEKSANPLFLPAAEIFIGPVLCFAAEISASWQHWLPLASFCPFLLLSNRF
jgi:hypothetical protein